MAMGFYQLAADRAMRELGITMVGGMLTTLEKDERARQMTGEGGTLVSAHCDVHVLVPVARAAARRGTELAVVR